MNKIGVIGDSDSIIGFKSLGIDVYPATGSDVMKTINQLGSRRIRHHICNGTGGRNRGRND